MSLSMDLKIRGQYGYAPLVLNGAPTASSSGGSTFSEVFSAAYQSVGATDYESCFQAASEAYQVPVNLLKAATSPRRWRLTTPVPARWTNAAVCRPTPRLM